MSPESPPNKALDAALRAVVWAVYAGHSMAPELEVIYKYAPTEELNRAAESLRVPTRWRPKS